MFKVGDYFDYTNITEKKSFLCRRKYFYLGEMSVGLCWIVVFRISGKIVYILFLFFYFPAKKKL